MSEAIPMDTPNSGQGLNPQVQGVDLTRPAITPRWIHNLALITCCVTFVLICMGGVVKSKQAGLSVPDWPQSYGHPTIEVAGTAAGLTLLLTLAWVITRKSALAIAAIVAGFALDVIYVVMGPSIGETPWYLIESVRAEHSHRLVAGNVGFLYFILTGAIWTTDRRPAVRSLALWGVVAVVLQAVLGGLTVRMSLPPIVSSLHGTLAQGFFLITIVLAYLTSPIWFNKRESIPQTDAKPFQKLARMLVIAFFVQIVLGTAVRHTNYGGGQGNESSFYWHTGAHLAGLLWVLHNVAKVSIRAIRRHWDVPAIAGPVKVLLCLLLAQIGLGIGILIYRLTVKLDGNPVALKEIVATSHVGFGALCLATAVFLTLQSHRVLAPAESKSTSGAAA